MLHDHQLILYPVPIAQWPIQVGLVSCVLYNVIIWLSCWNARSWLWNRGPHTAIALRQEPHQMTDVCRRDGPCYAVHAMYDICASYHARLQY